jgi:catalase
VVARFSVDECHATTETGQSLRGFSFRLGSDGQRSEILTQSAPVHFARTLDQMLAYLLAHMPGANSTDDARKLEAFSAANPETLHQADYIAKHPPPASLADTTYWAAHAFPTANPKGEARFIKFKVVPIGEEHGPASDEAAVKCSDLLLDDLEARIAARDVRFSVMALLDRPGDPVTDVTVRWPYEDRREAVRLGTIVITGVDETSDEPLFNPATLADGIGYPPDEMFAARCAAYAISQTKRV